MSLALALDQDLRAEGRVTGGVKASLPKTAPEIAPFVVKMDDRQARSLLVQTLEEGTRGAEPMPEREMLTMMESATGRLAARVGQIFGAAGEVVTSPVVFWRWLTAGGIDRTGPWRALAGGFLLIGIGWLAQAAAAFAIRKRMPLRTGVLRPDSAYLSTFGARGRTRTIRATRPALELSSSSDKNATPSHASHVLPNRDLWEA
jgi:hypothetical protein